MKLKNRIIIASCLGIIWIAILFNLEYSGSLAIVFPLIMLFLLFFLGFTVHSLIGTLILWKQHKAKTVIPFILCVALFMAGFGARTAGHRLRLADFRQNLAGFQSMADGVIRELRLKGHPLTASGFHYITEYSPPSSAGRFKVSVKYEEPDIYTVSFKQVVIPNHTRSYVYKDDGDFSNLFQEWEQVDEVINEHWRAVSD